MPFAGLNSSVVGRWQSEIVPRGKLGWHAVHQVNWSAAAPRPPPPRPRTIVSRVRSSRPPTMSSRVTGSPTQGVAKHRTQLQVRPPRYSVRRWRQRFRDGASASTLQRRAANCKHCPSSPYRKSNADLSRPERTPVATYRPRVLAPGAPLRSRCCWSAQRDSNPHLPIPRRLFLELQ